MRYSSPLLLLLLIIGGINFVPRLFGPLKGAKESKTSSQTLANNHSKGIEVWPKRPLNISTEQPFYNCRNRISALTEKGDFATIEKEAQQARTQKERLLGGTWKLEAIYWGTRYFLKDRLIDADWQRRQHQLRTWINQMPNSITARVALANLLTNYAWEARGDGLANTVSPPQWKLFKERLIQAHQVLEEAQQLQAKCPQLYCVALSVGLGLNWPPDTIDKIFAAGKEIEPYYHRLYSQKAVYLLPQWHGKDGEWETFLEQASESLEPEEGSILFFEVAAETLKFCNQMPSGQRRLRLWPKMKEGFFNIEKKYGLSLVRLNEGCYYATFSMDMEVAQKLFESLGDRWDANLWKTRKRFDEWKMIARNYRKP